MPLLPSIPTNHPAISNSNHKTPASICNRQKKTTAFAYSAHYKHHTNYSFEYTKKSRRGKGDILSTNFSFTFEPCCPQMTVRLAIREISANVAPLVLSETFNETSSVLISGSDSSLEMKVAVTMNKENI